MDRKRCERVAARLHDRMLPGRIDAEDAKNEIWDEFEDSEEALFCIQLLRGHCQDTETFFD